MEEYRVLRELSSHPNLPDFYGIYRKRTIKKNEQDEIWLVMQVRITSDEQTYFLRFRIVWDNQKNKGHFWTSECRIASNSMHNSVIHGAQKQVRTHPLGPGPRQFWSI